MAEDKTMNRRGALKALLGLVGVAVGATALVTSGTAEAAVPSPAPAATPPVQDVARDESLPESEATQYYYRRRPVYRRRVVRRRVYRRPVYRVYRRPVYRRRYIRRVYW